MKEKQSGRLRTWLLCTCLLLSLLLGLTACGSSSGYEGTWRWTEEGDEIQMELEENGQVLYYVVPVSYTHLDVYKRQ